MLRPRSEYGSWDQDFRLLQGVRRQGGVSQTKGARTYRRYLGDRRSGQMASRGLWRLMSARTRRLLTVSWSAFFLLSLMLQYFAFAIASPVAAQVGNNLFELDGNAVDNSGAALPDDWDKAFGGLAAADETKLINDGHARGADRLTGGWTK